MKRNRVFIDTEFVNLGYGQPISLISIGLVKEGAEFYGINVDAPLGRMVVHPFIRESVWPKLPLRPAQEVGATGIVDWDHEHPDIQHVYKIENLREHVYNFIVEDGPDVELWGDHSAFDYVVLSQLFGTFDDHPTGVPMLIKDIQQEIGEGAIPPRQDPATLHHALEDAKHVKALHEWMLFADPMSKLTPQKE